MPLSTVVLLILILGKLIPGFVGIQHETKYKFQTKNAF